MATVAKTETPKGVADAVESRGRVWEMSMMKAGDDAPNMTDRRLRAQLGREA